MGAPRRVDSAVPEDAATGLVARVGGSWRNHAAGGGDRQAGRPAYSAEPARELLARRRVTGSGGESGGRRAAADKATVLSGCGRQAAAAEATVEEGGGRRGDCPQRRRPADGGCEDSGRQAAADKTAVFVGCG